MSHNVQVLVLFVILIALWFFKVWKDKIKPMPILRRIFRRQSSCLGGGTLSKWKLFATLSSPLARPPRPSSCPSFSSFFHRSPSVLQFLFFLHFHTISMHGSHWIFYQTYDFWPFTSMKNSLKNAPSLITWRLIETKMCWGVIFLLGGGFALAKVCFHILMKMRLVRNL